MREPRPNGCYRDSADASAVRVDHERLFVNGESPRRFGWAKWLACGTVVLAMLAFPIRGVLAYAGRIHGAPACEQRDVPAGCLEQRAQDGLIGAALATLLLIAAVALLIQTLRADAKQFDADPGEDAVEHLRRARRAVALAAVPVVAVTILGALG